MPSVAPCPVVPIIVTAESWVAITDRPTAHHGRLRLARKYPSSSRVPLERRIPCVTTYASQPTTITQLSGCTSGREVVLEPTEQQKGDHLNGQHANERHPKAVVHRRSQASRAPSAMST